MASSLHLEDGDTAPTYTIPSRRLGALEHPMIIKNLDKGIKTFGQNNAFQAILDSASPQISVPLYLRYDNPTARPLTSHNALTHNVVLKVTVPKRTGRKRKRGTDGPWEGEVEQTADGGSSAVSPEVLSRDRLDTPQVIRRKLQDNVGKYAVEPIGVINNTHRYRGLADFQFALGESNFMKKFVDKVLPGDVAKLKEFSLQPGIESGSNIDLIPPPYFTPITLPFGYNYAQNPHTKEVSPGVSDASGNMSEDQEYERVVNVTSRVPAAGYFIAHDEYPVPTAPRRQPDMSDPQVAAIITEMRLAMEERPIWTRRSMWNRLGAKFAELPKNGGLVRHCLQYAGYQFKGGPWRDALVRYGLDPRADPKYRIYQTLIFKLHKTRIGSVGRSWQAVRRKELGVSNFGKAWQDLGVGDEAMLNTHVFNGESFSTDGKVWQVCDITDPLLARLFADAEQRAECDVEISGFYHRVLWSVAKAIMKCKMVAIRFNRTLTDDDFSAALEAVRGVPHDGGDGAGPGNSIGISLPDLQLTVAEYEQLRGGKYRPRPGIKSSNRETIEGVTRRRRTHYRVRIPLKEAEEREAVKMIRLLTQNAQDKKAAEEAAAASTDAEVAPSEAPPRQVEASEGVGAVVKRASVREEEEEGDERDQERGEGRMFQEILEDMEEEGSEEEDGSEEEESDEGEATPRKKLPFQERGLEEELEQEQYEEGGYSDEDDQEDMEEEDEEEEEDGYAGGEDGEVGYGEEEEFYDEEGEGFPQAWEDEAGSSKNQFGNAYYE
ncbi:RNA polymerase III transcription factor IIIC subunit-domain-containing protein [Chaetomium fimeti]|uniref:RNA polymerase III transcription factor IIIC subunit-domain-containing protein n=1 Tax=Chaetomium fimeti TaxID=1854472 RepID=A0AAE0LTJ1_9PEZI|nr:RNA polymerase III transcription factor IIIC subunit-domain-containing protein [Chaetomium fimeti]